MNHSMPLHDWPEADRRLWEALRRQGGPFDARGALARLRESSARMEPTLPFMEAGPVHAALQARLGHVAEFPRQFQHAEPLLCNLPAAAASSPSMTVPWGDPPSPPKRKDKCTRDP